MLSANASRLSRPSRVSGHRAGPPAAWPAQLCLIAHIARCQYVRPSRPVLVKAAAAMPAEQHSEDTPFGLPLPDARYQKSMKMKEFKALRAAANTAAANKQLKYTQVGRNGVTEAFLCDCMNILANHEFVRVKLGEESGLDREETANGLARLLDCLVVHRIGFTITLYRQKGLPRPSNCIPKTESAEAVPTPSNEAPSSGSTHAASPARKPRQPRKQDASKLPPEIDVV